MQPCKDKGGYRQFRYKKKNGLIHAGTDLNCDIGEICRVMDEGIVLFSGLAKRFGSNGTDGHVIIVQHSGYVSLYGHVKGIIKEKQFVKNGQILGHVEAYYSGKNDWTHVHWLTMFGSGIPKTKWGYVKESEIYLFCDPWGLNGVIDGIS
jgi:murein DD-endopeptidase MepM/ murein hydrolase activator NlpD